MSPPVGSASPEVSPPDNDSPPANIRSPELVADTHAVLRGATRSQALAFSAGEGGPCRSWQSQENVTSGLRGFAGGQTPDNDSPPANIRSPELVADTHAVLRGATRSQALAFSAGEDGPCRSWRSQGNVTSGLRGFAEVRPPDNDSPPAIIRSPELVAGTHAVLRGTTRSPALAFSAGEGGPCRSWRPVPAARTKKNSPPPA